MKIILQFLMLLLPMISCKPNIENIEVKSRYDQVMFVHDEVMPKMSPMNGLKKRLLKNQKDRINDPEISQKISTAIADIEKADEEMMDWMAEFKLPKDKSNNEQLEYLKEEQKKVELVRVNIETAMSNASILLSQI